MSDAFGTFDDNDSSDGVAISGSATIFVGSAVNDDFGGGTVVVEIEGPDGNWYPTSESFDEPDVRRIDLAMPSVIRLTLAGSTSPDLDYAIQSDVDVRR